MTEDDFWQIIAEVNEKAGADMAAKTKALVDECTHLGRVTEWKARRHIPTVRARILAP